MVSTGADTYQQHMVSTELSSEAASRLIDFYLIGWQFNTSVGFVMRSPKAVCTAKKESFWWYPSLALPPPPPVFPAPPFLGASHPF
jgi:hypothetical protein